MESNYAQLVKALRHCNGPSFLTCRECQYSNDMLTCIYKMLRDAAAAIEDLQAQLPKLGEWQKAKPHGVVTYSDGYAECSHCHEAIWLGWGMNFCPHCGTQNKIIDPDDYDGAKMEVQDA